MNGLAHAPARTRREQPFDQESYFEGLTCAYEVACQDANLCHVTGDRDGARQHLKRARELRREINKIAKRLYGAGSPVARLLTIDFERASARRRRQWQ